MAASFLDRPESHIRYIMLSKTLWDVRSFVRNPAEILVLNSPFPADAGYQRVPCGLSGPRRALPARNLRGAVSWWKGKERRRM